MKIAITTMLCAAAILSTPALAQDTATAATPAVATAQDTANPVVCRMAYHEGTVISAKRTCLTEQQWKTLRLENQQAVRELQIRADFQLRN
jgi:predicted transglutaminase-like cysteine proteinase